MNKQLRNELIEWLNKQPDYNFKGEDFTTELIESPDSSKYILELAKRQFNRDYEGSRELLEPILERYHFKEDRDMILNTPFGDEFTIRLLEGMKGLSDALAMNNFIVDRMNNSYYLYIRGIFKLLNKKFLAEDNGIKLRQLFVYLNMVFNVSNAKQLVYLYDYHMTTIPLKSTRYVTSQLIRDGYMASTYIIRDELVVFNSRKIFYIIGDVRVPDAPPFYVKRHVAFYKMKYRDKFRPERTA